MNSAQKTIRAVGLLLLVVLVLFPPWKLSFTTPPENAPGSDSIGYHPLWYRYEQAPDETRTNVQQRINLLWLGLELGAVLIVTNLGLLLFKGRKA
jgi:hypothetical protein